MPGLRKLKDGAPIPGVSIGNEFLPNGTGWFDRHRLKANAGNDYLVDREAQRERSFSGIEGIHLQDQAMTESMGEIVDHTHEHLAISDLMITRTRRRMIQAARAAEQGIAPPGVDHPDLFQGARGGDFLSAASTGWLEAYGQEMRGAKNPTGALRAAAQ